MPNIYTYNLVAQAKGLETAQMKESELLSTWLWAKHRTALQWRNTRLGLLPTKELARMYMVTLRWVDAIFIENGVVHLVEAKLTPQPVSQVATARRKPLPAAILGYRCLGPNSLEAEGIHLAALARPHTPI